MQIAELKGDFARARLDRTEAAAQAGDVARPTRFFAFNLFRPCGRIGGTGIVIDLDPFFGTTRRHPFALPERCIEPIRIRHPALALAVRQVVDVGAGQSGRVGLGVVAHKPPKAIATPNQRVGNALPVSGSP